MLSKGRCAVYPYSVEAPERLKTQFVAADNDAKPVKPLEVASESIALLDSIPYAICAEQIAYALSNRDRVREGFLAMHDAWQQRGLDRMRSMLAETEFWRCKIVREALVEKRNANWIEPLAWLAESRPIARLP